MKCTSIGTSQLREMQEILSESAGYQVSIDEEIGCFDPVNSRGWTLLTGTDGSHIGFIRHLRQGGEWSLGELFLKSGIEDRATAAIRLLTDWQVAASLPAGHRVRFDIPKNDYEINVVLEQNGFSQKCQLFRHFELAREHAVVGAISTEIALASDAAGVAEALSNLHPVDAVEALTWIEAGSIRVIRDGCKIAAAAQIFESSEAIEINRFATNANFLRRGHGAKLLDQMIFEVRNVFGKRLYLKVEDVRTAAIKLYKKVGFVENCDKAQIWHSRWF